jgi:hypothetical protein
MLPPLGGRSAKSSGKASVAVAGTVPEHVRRGDVPRVSLLSGSTRGLEVLVNPTSRRWIDICDHCSPQTLS